MKRVLITGGAGFIAHHLVVRILKNTDWEVVTLDRLDYSGNLNRLHDALLFLLDRALPAEPDFGGAKCPKFNIVGPEELDNLAFARIIADTQGKELIYDMVDFHSSRPGHDLRYALSGEKMRRLGRSPAKDVRTRVAEVVRWTIDNPRWITL